VPAFKHWGLDRRKKGGFLSLEVKTYKDPLPRREDPSSLSSGWEKKHSICCLGDNTEYSDCALA